MSLSELSDPLGQTFVLITSIQSHHEKKFLRPKVRELKDLEDLVGQLGVWLSAKYEPQACLSLSEQKLHRLLCLLEDIERLTSRRFPVLILRRKEITSLRLRMEDALAELVTEDQLDHSSKRTNTSLQRPSIDDLFPLNLISQAPSSKQRIDVALKVSRVLKEALALVPIAGGALSATFGIASLFLEKHKTAHDSPKVLLDIRAKLEMILQCLELSGISIASAGNEDIISRNPVSPNIDDKIKELSRLFTRARDLARSRKGNNVEAQSQLLNSIEQYRRDIVTIVSAENQIKNIIKNHQIKMAALTGIFFSSVSV